MGALETNTTLIYGVHIRESANDGSDFTNAAADYRILFLGEDGALHVKDSGGSVTDIGGSSGGITAGVAFPGSPATDDLFHRTDRDLVYFYDGTRWLTINEYSVACGPLDVLFPVTTTANNSYGSTYQGANGAYITRAELVTISVNNDGSNYHTCQLKSRVAAGTTTNLGSSFTTAADTPNNNVRHTVTVGAVLGASDQQFLVTYTRTGSNASIYVTVLVFYRLIG